VVEIAYETLGATTVRGLVIVGIEGELHPIHFFRCFLEMVKAGQLDSAVAECASEVESMIRKMQGIVHHDPGPADQMRVNFDTFVPALPCPSKVRRRGSTNSPGRRISTMRAWTKN